MEAFSFEHVKVKSVCEKLAFRDALNDEPAKNPKEMFINSAINMVRAILFRRQFAEDRIKEEQNIE